MVAIKMTFKLEVKETTFFMEVTAAQLLPHINSHLFGIGRGNDAQFGDGVQSFNNKGRLVHNGILGDGTHASDGSFYRRFQGFGFCVHNIACIQRKSCRL
jgi:hypothetical protein